MLHSAPSDQLCSIGSMRIRAEDGRMNLELQVPRRLRDWLERQHVALQGSNAKSAEFVSDPRLPESTKKALLRSTRSADSRSSEGFALSGIVLMEESCLCLAGCVALTHTAAGRRGATRAEARRTRKVEMKREGGDVHCPATRRSHSDGRLGDAGPLSNVSRTAEANHAIEYCTSDWMVLCGTVSKAGLEDMDEEIQRGSTSGDLRRMTSRLCFLALTQEASCSRANAMRTAEDT